MIEWIMDVVLGDVGKKMMERFWWERLMDLGRKYEHDYDDRSSD